MTAAQYSDSPETDPQAVRSSGSMPDPGVRTHWRGILRKGCFVLLAVVLLLLVIPLVLPAPTAPNTVGPDVLADPDSRFVTIDGIEFHYKERVPECSSSTIILIHGFGASTYSWHRVIDELGEQSRVVAFDRPGFGLTSRPMPEDWTGTNPYSLSAQADQTISLMDELEIGRAVLVGHSAGSAVAVLAASRHPDRVSALVLEAPAILEDRGFPDWAGPLLRSPQMRWIGPLLARRVAATGSDRAIVDSFYDRPLATTEVIDAYRLPLRARDWDRALWEYSIAPGPGDMERALKSLPMPVLVISPAEDSLVEPTLHEQVAGLVPDASFESFPQTGHLAHEEAPERFAALVLRFIETLEASGIT